jgi:hypothetical protein
MKTNGLLAVVALFAMSVMTQAAPKDDVVAAAKKLGDKANYSWKATTAVPEGSQFRPGPVEGKTQKDGLTLISLTFGDNTTSVVIKGDKGAIKRPNEDWQSSEVLESNAPRGLGVYLRTYPTPAVQAAEIAAGTEDLKKDGDTFTGELTEEGAKQLISFRRRGADAGDRPGVRDAKGSVKFWLKDGVVAKYEYKVKGTRSFDGNDREIDRTTTVEIKDVDKTKLDVPDEAKKKL